MNKQIYIDKLSKLGIGTDAAEIYLYLIQNGPTTILQLSRDLNIERSKIYRNAQVLSENGLISETHAAWGKKLSAAPVDNLNVIANNRRLELEQTDKLIGQLIPELQKISRSTKASFQVRNYYAQEGIRQMLWNHLQADGEIVAFSYKNRNDIVGKNFAEKIRQEQVKRKIMLYEIENETDQDNFWYTDVEGWGDYYDSIHVNTSVLDIKQHVAVFNDTVSFINWLDGEEVGVEITNRALAEMQCQLFWKVWHDNQL